jgi:hypothetical protein
MSRPRWDLATQMIMCMRYEHNTPRSTAIESSWVTRCYVAHVHLNRRLSPVNTGTFLEQIQAPLFKRAHEMETDGACLRHWKKYEQ